MKLLDDYIGPASRQSKYRANAFTYSFRVPLRGGG